MPISCAAMACRARPGAVPPSRAASAQAMKEGMRGYGPWTIHFTAFAECLPYKDNTLTLNPDQAGPLRRAAGGVQCHLPRQ